MTKAYATKEADATKATKAQAEAEAKLVKVQDENAAKGEREKETMKKQF